MTDGFPIPLRRHGFGASSITRRTTSTTITSPAHRQLYDVSMEMIMGFGGSNGWRHGNGGGACSIAGQMGRIKSGQCHKD